MEDSSLYVTEKRFYDLWSVSSLFGSRIVILPRESLTRPSPWKYRSIRVITSLWEPRWFAIVSWVIFSSFVPSMDDSSKRNEATRLSKLFHMICSISHMKSCMFHIHFLPKYGLQYNCVAHSGISGKQAFPSQFHWSVPSVHLQEYFWIHPYALIDFSRDDPKIRIFFCFNGYFKLNRPHDTWGG